MVIPYIASIMKEVFDMVPPLLKESSYGIGCTTWETIWHVVLPTPAPVSWAASCWALAARSVKRWP